MQRSVERLLTGKRAIAFAIVVVCTIWIYYAEGQRKAAQAAVARSDRVLEAMTTAERQQLSLLEAESAAAGRRLIIALALSAGLTIGAFFLLYFQPQPPPREPVEAEAGPSEAEEGLAATYGSGGSPAPNSAGAREAEQRYRTLFAESPDSILLLDPATELPIEFNDDACNQLGYSREEFMQLPVGGYEIRDEGTPRARFEKVLRHGHDDFETRHRTKDGEVRVREVIATAVDFAAGMMIQCLYRDITERKRVEQGLRETEQRFRLFVESVTEYALISLDADGFVVSWNAGAERMKGYTAEQIIGRHMTCFYSPEDIAAGRPQANLRCAREAGIAKDEGWRVRRDGSRFWAELVLTAQGDENRNLRGFSKVTCDRTAQKRAREELLASNRRLAEAQKIALMGDWEWNFQSQKLTVSDQVYTIFGLRPEDGPPTYHDLLSRIHPDDRPSLDELGRSIVPSGGSLDVDLRLVLPGRADRWITGRAFVAVDGEGKPARVFGAVQDITERVHTQQELAESERRYRQIVETTNEGIWSVDEEGQTTFVNQRIADILGYGIGEMMGTPAYLFVAAEQPGEAESQSRQMWSSTVGDSRLRRSDGATVWVSASTSPLIDDRGKHQGILGMFTDVTGRRQLEEQLTQAQKMESIGRLAGGIAHDFNNILTIIKGYTALMLRGLGPGDPTYKHLTQMKMAADRAAEVTRQLLAFSRKQVIHPKILDLNRLVNEVVGILRSVIGEDIELVTRLDAELGSVKVDPAQMHQVLMNLALNARDAMPGGGTLMIETANVVLDEQYVREHAEVERGLYIQLAISDSGTGIDQATLPHIFEPFFTTKPAGEGTGLGLAMVHGIVKQAGGSIWVYSEPGQGATFKIYFPQVEAAVMETAEPQEEAGPAGELVGSETILVVEDQAELRELAEYVLTSYGYKVLEAPNGVKALAVSERFDGPIPTYC